MRIARGSAAVSTTQIEVFRKEFVAKRKDAPREGGPRPDKKAKNKVNPPIFSKTATRHDKRKCCTDKTKRGLSDEKRLVDPVIGLGQTIHLWAKGHALTNK